MFTTYIMDSSLRPVFPWFLSVRSDISINKTVTIDRSSVDCMSLSNPAVQLIQGLESCALVTQSPYLF